MFHHPVASNISKLPREAKRKTRAACDEPEQSKDTHGMVFLEQQGVVWSLAFHRLVLTGFMLEAGDLAQEPGSRC